MVRVAVELPPGLIPAHAGKIGEPGSPDDEAGAHPRSRGENVPTILNRTGGTGSSPLTRGKCQTPGLALPYLGLIPAHAGKIEITPTTGPAAWAHPRSRGENLPPGPPRL